MKYPEHVLTDEEREALDIISRSVAPEFAGLALKFMLQCRDAGFTPKVAVSSFALATVANLVKLCLKTAKIPAVEMPDEAIMEMAFKVHEQMMQLAGDFVVQKNKEAAAPFN